MWPRKRLNNCVYPSNFKRKACKPFVLTVSILSKINCDYIHTGSVMSVRPSVTPFTQIGSFALKSGFMKHMKVTFLNFYLLIFLKLYLMTDIDKWVKVTVLDFWGKRIICSKLGLWVQFYNRGSIITSHLSIVKIALL